MFIEFNEHPRDQVIETDVCIIGAGAAGISLTHALLGSQLDVCLLETGRLTRESIHYQLAVPEVRTGDFRTAGCRLRQFGGTTNHWGGNSKPLSDIDFAKREWVPYSGWPISRGDVEPWYEEANRMVGGGVYAYTRDKIVSEEWPFPEFDFELLDEAYWRIAEDPTSFSGIYQDTFTTANNVRVFLNATATELHADTSASTVTSAAIRSPEGNSSTIKARYFVIAAGCLESSRLLLASRSVQSEGLGNANDMVGRFFMMHPHANVGRIVDMDESFEKLFERYKHGGADIVSGFSIRTDIQRSERILNAGIQLQGLIDTESGYSAFRKMRRELERAYIGWQIGAENIELPDEFGDWMWMALKDIDSVAAGLWGESTGQSDTGAFQRNKANIYIQAEQAPNPASRITLGTELDSLGVPRMIQDCRVLPIDKRTLRVVGELLGRELGMLGAGRVQLEEWLLDDTIEWEDSIWGGCHHMGTTRMSTSPSDGVVDANCKIHNLDNTFVASGSVFSTGGHANPTMNIVALALRLADHLKKMAS